MKYLVVAIVSSHYSIFNEGESIGRQSICYEQRRLTANKNDISVLVLSVQNIKNEPYHHLNAFFSLLIL